MDRVVATSPNYAETSPVLATLRHKLDVIPIGLDETSYPPVDEALVGELEGDYGRDFFVFVGVLRYYKGLRYLLQTLQGTALRVVIVGSGPERDRLEQMAGLLGLTGVRFAGQVDDRTKVALISLSRAMVFPSCARSEAFGVALLEAAMLRRPMITTEVGSGTSYVNRDGETGLVVPPADPAALREAMLRLERDSGLAERMGEGARRRFERLFAAEAMGEGYVALYRELTQRAVMQRR
jgi:rhamnosyl/mannosyltransferase